MSLDKRVSPLLAKYLEQYQKNPHSRVFAALAETYRQLGMLDKAIDLLQDGINKHPHYALGYLGLALCYQEREEYGLVYSTLRPIVNSNRDNLKLQKVFANACQQLENFPEALETYKYLLFLNPKDREAIERLELLKDQERVLKNTGNAPEIFAPSLFNLSELEVATADAAPDNWVQLDLQPTPSRSTANFQERDDDFAESADDCWQIGALKNNPAPVDLISSPMPEPEETSIPLDSGPVLTLTLIDLYISQKHYAKASSALEQLLSTSPSDQKILDKCAQLQGLMEQNPSLIHSPPKEDSVLMAAYDQKIAAVGVDRGKKVAEKLSLFLAKIKARSFQIAAGSDC